MRDPEDWNNRLDFNGKVGIQNLFECSFNIIYRVVAQLVSALVLGTRGRRFELGSPYISGIAAQMVDGHSTVNAAHKKRNRFESCQSHFNVLKK